MRLYKELNIFEDKKLFMIINLLSLVILIVTLGVILIIHYLITGRLPNFTFQTHFFWVVGILLVSLPVHELVHGIFFRLFAKSGKVRYGFAMGMLYASNPGQIYTKTQFIIIALAPFVINSMLFLLLSIIGIEGTVMWAVFILHTSACAGDFWYVYEMIKNPAITHCEDTPVGIKLFVCN